MKKFLKKILKILGKKNVSFIWKFVRGGRLYRRIIEITKEYSPFDKLTVSLNSSLGVRAVKYTKIIKSPPKKIKIKIKAFHMFHILMKIKINTLTLCVIKQNISKRGCLNIKMKNKHKIVSVYLSFITENLLYRGVC